MNKFFNIIINENNSFVIIVYLIFYINFIIYNNRRVRYFFILNFYKLNLTNRYDNIKRYEIFITNITTNKTFIILNFNILFHFLLTLIAIIKFINKLFLRLIILNNKK